MSGYVDHAWRHRPKALGGTDPIESCYIRARITSTNVTAGDQSTSGFIGIPFHEDYSPSGIQIGGFSLDGDGGIVLPGEGFYQVTTYAFFNDSDWTSNNFNLVNYFLTGTQALDDILGSQNLGGETLEHSLAHDGTGLTATTDRRKPEMRSQAYFMNLKSFTEPVRIVPTYYSYTSGLTTGWAVFETVVVLVGGLGSLVTVPS